MGELIANLEGYSIYKAYSDKSGDYYLCVPNGNILGCQIFLGFSDKELDTLSNDEVVLMINDVNNMILGLNSNSIYVVPDIKSSVLEQATLENDDPMYLDILNNKIQPVMADVYNMLIKNGIKPNNINQVVQVVEKNDRDKKLGGWLSMKLGDSYIKEVDYQHLKEEFRKKGDIHKLEVGEKENEDISIPTSDNSLEHVQETQSTFSSGIAPISREYENEQTQSKGNKLVKKLTKSTDVSPGFSSIKFIITTLLLSLVAGVAIGYLIMK